MNAPQGGCMTTDNEIDQAQQGLDAEQGIVSEINEDSQISSLQQKLDQQDRQIKELSGMVNSNRGHVDRALNSIRQETTVDRNAVEKILDDRLASVNSQMQQEQMLEGLNEEQRPIFEHMLNKLEVFEKSSVSQTVAQLPIEEPPKGSSDPWQDIYDMVIDMGLNQLDSRIQYRLLLDESVEPRQRQSNFLNNIMSVRDAGVQSNVQPQAAQQQPSANPPVESMSPSSSTAFRTSGDIRDAYISGKITTDVFHERMRAIGEDI